MAPSSKTDRKRRRARGVAVPAPKPPAEPRASTPAPEPRGRAAWLFAALCVASFLGLTLSRSRAPRGAAAAVRSSDDAAPPSHRPTGPARPGELDARYVEILLPARYVSASECVRAQEAWVFRGRAAGAVASALTASGMDAAQVERARGLTRCDPSGCIVTPDAALIESLSRGARSALYTELARAKENRLHALAALRPAEMGPWTAMAHVNPRVRELIGRATWTLDGSYAFSDLSWLCNQLATDDERLEAVTTLYSRYTLDAALRVPAAGDLEAMVRYWSVGNVEDDVRGALAAARGASVPVSSLLPAMARARLGHYPAPGDPEYDCYWSSTRFFAGATPHDDVPDVSRAEYYLTSAYAEVTDDERRLGDLYVLRNTSTGDLVHMANHVAGDVVFTKNGRSHTRPWALMHLRDMRRIFPFTTTRVYRRR
jgi:hypothetical protein